MSQAPETLEGWYALHDFRKIDWAAWAAMSPEVRNAAVDEAVSLFQSAERVEDAAEGATAFYTIIGHKADLLLLHLRPTLEELQRLETRFDKSRLGAVTDPVYSYFSVTELSFYTAPSEPKGDPMDNPFVKKRLKPEIPDWSHICFYPMDKKRGETQNWYSLPMEERRELMQAHSVTGRKYAGKVVQLITGSVGFDEYEWGVTLFADDPLQFKKLVYEMRFDEVSAKYAVFGDFLVGTRLRPAGLPEYLRLEA